MSGLNPLTVTDRLRDLRPDLVLADRLAAHASWALKDSIASEEGGKPIEWESYILHWTPPPHPLAKLFNQAIDNGHRVSIISERGTAKFNQGER